jgi:hypothetical protein
MKAYCGRLLPGLIAGLLSLAALLPVVATQPQHGDEAQYIWSSAYYGSKIAHLDFRAGSSDPVSDPGWAPASYWNVTQPMGSRAIYALALGLAQAEIPEPRSHYSPEDSAPDELVAPRTLEVARFAGVACAALGFALIALRLGWRGLVPLALLGLPQARSDLARAWAEGPLLLGFGLAMMFYGRRGFAVVAGLATTFKLTALGLWPLVFLQASFGRSPARRLLGVGVSAAVWTLLTPSAWFGAGPVYLVLMLLDRQREYARSAAAAGGVFAPGRYWWPVELGILLAIACALPKLGQWLGRARIRWAARLATSPASA